LYHVNYLVGTPNLLVNRNSRSEKSEGTARICIG
jgi:hypothetical protein